MKPASFGSTVTLRSADVYAMTTLTLAFSNHRIEILPYAADLMRRHRTVVLEEAPDPDFQAMLNGDCPIGTYVSRLDTEYPEFSRESCRLFRELSSQGIDFYQVEPYLARLLQIHEMFAQGQSPVDIPQESPLMPVYLTEREATKRLIQYYAAAAKGSFDEVLERLKRFARADARRFRLRDQLRARAILDLADRITPGYIEAGTMHIWLRSKIRQGLPRHLRLNSRHLISSKVRELTGRSVLMGPGDILTLIYIYNTQEKSLRCDQLAAKSIIFNKIVGKVEKATEGETFPHLKDEWRAKEMVRQLNLSDCAALFPKIRRVQTQEANAHVNEYLAQRTSVLLINR